MEKNGEILLSIGELAKKTDVSVRTLQHYDRFGLLTPGYSEGGRRIYDRDGVVRLQQILFLKSLGFSLEEIRDRLLPSQSAEELEAMLTEQKRILRNHVSNLQEALSRIETVVTEIRSGGKVGIDKLLAISDMVRRNPCSFLTHKYVTSDQIERAVDRFDTAENLVEFNLKCEAVFSRMFELYAKGTDPAAPESQNLVAEWWSLIMRFTGGDTELLGGLVSAGIDAANWPDDVKEFKQAVREFLERAFSVYFSNNGIDPRGGTSVEKGEDISS